MTERAPYLVAARRTPIGRVGGALRHLTVEHLAAPVLRALLADQPVDAAAIGEVILGNVFGPGGNPARLALLEAGLPIAVPGLSVDRQCGSGLEAITLGARLIEAGAAEVVIAGGVESASTAPWRLERPRHPAGLPRAYPRARFAPDRIGDPDMGIAAENVARRCTISRQRQDRFALSSHQKAVAAGAEGRFAAEIVPLPAADAAAPPVSVDECPRADTSLARLAALPPVFLDGGTVTAGNACPINDGAAAVLLVSPRHWRHLGRPPALRFRGAAAAGCDPNLLGLGPVPATRAVLRRTGTAIDDIDIVEFNEAFAAQVLASLDALGIGEEKVNPGGGAIALGHPWGASGAVLVVRLFGEMVRRRLPGRGRLGLATLGIGGGMGVSALWEAAD